jgi:hypothetical protein
LQSKTSTSANGTKLSRQQGAKTTSGGEARSLLPACVGARWTGSFQSITVCAMRVSSCSLQRKALLVFSVQVMAQ